MEQPDHGSARGRHERLHPSLRTPDFVVPSLYGFCQVSAMYVPAMRRPGPTPSLHEVLPLRAAGCPCLEALGVNPRPPNNKHPEVPNTRYGAQCVSFLLQHGSFSIRGWGRFILRGKALIDVAISGFWGF